MKSGTRLSPRSSRSLFEHQRSPVSGCMASPTQFRNPLANTRRFLAAGSNTRTAARPVSLPHALHRAATRGGKIAHDHLGFPPRLEVAAAIGVANHRSRVGDIYPLRIRAGRIERYAERMVEA